MKNQALWKGIQKVTVIAIMAMVTLLSCDADNSNTTSEDYRSRITNTSWQLSEVMNQNNQWLTPSVGSGLDIPELRFGSDNSFRMRTNTEDGYRGSVTGFYGISDGTINLTAKGFSGIAFSLRIITFAGNIIEGLFTIWGMNSGRILPMGTEQPLPVMSSTTIYA